MGTEVRNFAVTIPAGTAIAAATVTALSMPPRVVDAIRWRVPPGPNGNVGFALATGGVTFLPYGAGQWIVANDESDRIDLSDQITSGAWQLRGYNTGTQDHTIYLTFYLRPIPQPVATLPAQPLNITPAAAAVRVSAAAGSSLDEPSLST
jgi:hypothetical protein